MRTLDRSTCWRLEAADRYAAVAARVDGRTINVARCPICGEADRERFTEVRGFVFVQCRECRHIYMESPPDEETMHDLYAADEDLRAAQAKVYVDERLFALRVERIARPKIDQVRVHVEPGGRWVDVGCATGEVLAAAREAGWEPLGLETDPTEVGFARSRGLDVRQLFITADNAGEWLADAAVVSLLNVLEHVIRPVEFLAGLAAELAPGAYVVVEVPRHPSVSSLSNMLFPQVACRHIYAPEHLHVFSEDAAERMLDRAGLEAVSVWVFGQDFQELIASAALTAGVGGDAFVDSVLDKTPGLQQAIDDADLSDSLFVLSRRP